MLNPNVRRIESLQALRGLAVLLVLVYHIGVYEAKCASQTILGENVKFGASGVDLFFVISGYVMVEISGKASALSPRSFLLARVLRIYPLYWFFTAIALFVFLVEPGLANRPGGIAETSVWKSFLLIPEQGAPLVGQGWTLVHEMYFYCGFALLLNFSKRYLGVYLMVWAFVVVLWNYVFRLNELGICESLRPMVNVAMSPLTLEFLGGCALAKVLPLRKVIYARFCFWCGMSILFLGPLFLSGDKILYLGREFFYGIPAILIVAGAVSIESISSRSGPRFLRYLGDASYSIYLSHIFALSACTLVWKRFGGHGIGYNTFFLILMAAVSVLAGVVCFHLIECRLMKMTGWIRRREELHSKKCQ